MPSSSSSNAVFAQPPVAPSWLIGLWRREAIEYPDGRKDTATEVSWGQSSRLYVDLRIPQDRPANRGRRSFDEYSLEELALLAEQKGFAGHIVMDGDVCTWMRSIDYRPPTGRPDRGRLRLDGDTLYEEGDASSILASIYREIYHRAPRTSRPSAALRVLSHRPASPAISDCAGSMLVFVDDCFLFARDRAQPLPPAESLRELIVSAGDDRARIHAYLDCEISLGPASGARPTIARSTLPFREGQELFESITASLAQGGAVIVQESALGRIEWQLLESSIPTASLIRLMHST